MRRPRRAPVRASCSGTRWFASSSTRFRRARTARSTTCCSPAGSTTGCRPRWWRRWRRRSPSAGSRSASFSAPRTSSPRRPSSRGAITSDVPGGGAPGGGTVLLETGPGHATRCLASPFVDEFRDEKRSVASQRPRSRGAAEPPRAAQPRPAAHRGQGHGSSSPVRPGPDRAQARLARPRAAVGARDVHDRPGRGAARPRSARSPSCTARSPSGAPNAWPPCRFPSSSVTRPCRGPTAAPGRRRDRRHRLHLPGRRRPARPSGRTSSTRSTRSPRSRRPLGLASVLRPGPERARQDLLALGRLHRRRALRPVAFGMPPNSLRSIEPFQLLGLLVAEAALATPATRSGRSRASARR